MRARIVRAVLVAALVACSGTDVPSDLPHQQTIPPSATAIFKFDPAQMTYVYHDTTFGNNTHLYWLTNASFAGTNCVAFSPRSATEDTIGTFVFVARGPNTGWVERHDQGAVDTTTAYLLAGGEGSRGTYLIDSTNAVHLFWQNGEQYRYFDPSAAITLTGNDLTSDVYISLNADSVNVHWGVVWTLVTSC